MFVSLLLLPLSASSLPARSPGEHLTTFYSGQVFAHSVLEHQEQQFLVRAISAWKDRNPGRIAALEDWLWSSRCFTLLFLLYLSFSSDGSALLPRPLRL